MSRPLQTVKVYKIQVRPEKPKPFIVRHSIDGREMPPRSFDDMDLADAYRAKIFARATDVTHPTRWDTVTGLPVDWNDAPEMNLATYAKIYLQQEWGDLEPRTRKTYAIVLTVMTERCCAPSAPGWSVAQRSEYRRWLAHEELELSPRLAAWCAKYSRALGDLDKVSLGELDRRLRRRVTGSAPLGKDAAGRQVKVARRCLDFAVRAGLMASNDWPKADPGTARRKTKRAKRAAQSPPVPLGAVVEVTDVHKVVAAQHSTQHRPDRLFRCLDAIGFFVGSPRGLHAARGSRLGYRAHLSLLRRCRR